MFHFVGTGVEIDLEQSEYTTTEGSGMLEVALVKTNVSDVPVTVLLTTISDSATGANDQLIFGLSVFKCTHILGVSSV